MSEKLYLNQLFEEGQGKKMLVLGDLMVDRYLWGRVERISPEAPVPVVDVYKEEHRHGGAANVALNLQALGADPVMCGIIGKDKHGDAFLERCEKEGLETSGIIQVEDRMTTVKTRVIGNKSHLLRIDRENREEISAELSGKVIERVHEILAAADGVIIEDYNKGLITLEILKAAIKRSNALEIPSVIDPKFSNFLAYDGSTLFKPNLKELNEAFGEKLDFKNIDGLLETIDKLRERMPHRLTLVTLGEGGMLGVDRDGHFHLPAHLRKITDVSGAGDTVIAVAGLGLACGIPFEASAGLANYAGGLVCEEVGVVPVSKAMMSSNVLS